jgi:hypothetical protein
MPEADIIWVNIIIMAADYFSGSRLACHAVYSPSIAFPEASGVRRQSAFFCASGSLPVQILFHVRAAILCVNNMCERH